MEKIWNWIKTFFTKAFVKFKGLFPAHAGWFFISYVLILFSVFVIILFLFGLFLHTFLPDILKDFADPEHATNRYSYHRMFGVLTVTGALIGYAFSFLRVFNNERQTQTIEQGHITDQINKAVENLGANRGDGTTANIEMRMGAIYALERLAQDSARNHIMVLEILSSYIRNNAPREDSDTEADTDNPPRIDIQIALTVIGRNPAKTKKGENFSVDLQGCDLQNADLNKAQLQGAYFYGAQLQGADFDEAQLQGAYFHEAKLQGAYFYGAKLQKAEFHRAELQGARFKNTNLSSAQAPTQEQIDSAFGDGTVKLPKGLMRPAHWPDWSLEYSQFDKAYHKWQDNPTDYTAPSKPDGTP